MEGASGCVIQKTGSAGRARLAAITRARPRIDIDRARARPPENYCAGVSYFHNSQENYGVKFDTRAASCSAAHNRSSPSREQRQKAVRAGKHFSRLTAERGRLRPRGERRFYYADGRAGCHLKTLHRPLGGIHYARPSSIPPGAGSRYFSAAPTIKRLPPMQRAPAGDGGGCPNEARALRGSVTPGDSGESPLTLVILDFSGEGAGGRNDRGS